MINFDFDLGVVLEELDRVMYINDLENDENTFKTNKLKEYHRKSEQLRRARLSKHFENLHSLISNPKDSRKLPSRSNIIKMTRDQIQRAKTQKNNSLREFLDVEQTKYLYKESPSEFSLLIDCFTGNVMFVSTNINSVLFYSPNEWLNHSIFEFVHPDDEMKIRALFDSIDEGHEKQMFDNRTGTTKLSNDKQNFNNVKQKCSFTCRVRVGELFNGNNNIELQRIDSDVLDELGIWTNKTSSNLNLPMQDKNSYLVIHVHGFIGSFMTYNQDFCSTKTCLLATARIHNI